MQDKYDGMPDVNDLDEVGDYLKRACEWLDRYHGTFELDSSELAEYGYAHDILCGAIRAIDAVKNADNDAAANHLYQIRRVVAHLERLELC